MLKKLTKSGEYVHFLIIGIILTFYILSSPVNFIESSTPYPAPLGQWIHDFIALYPVLGKVINVVLIVILSLFVNKTGTSSELLPRQSYISSSLLTLFLLFSPPTASFTGCLILTLLLTFSFSNLIGIFGKQYPYKEILNATVAISVSSLIVPQAFSFIIFIWLGFLTFSVNAFREWIISIIGLIIPYIYVIFAWYWNDNLNLIFDHYTEYFRSVRLSFVMPAMLQIITLSVMAIIYVSGLLYFINDASEKIINIRKRIWVAFQFSFISIVTLILGSSFYYLFLPLVYISISIMLSYTLHYRKKSNIYDILIVLLIILLIFNRLGL